MNRLKVADCRVRHKKTGLYLLVENLGRPKAENDLYSTEDDSSVFATKAEAIRVAKGLGLRSAEFAIE